MFVRQGLGSLKFNDEVVIREQAGILIPDERPRKSDSSNSSPWQGVRLEAGEGANRLTKHAQATRCRKNDGSTLANLPAGDIPRVSLRSPVRANRTPGSVRGAPGNRCPYLDSKITAF